MRLWNDLECVPAKACSCVGELHRRFSSPESRQRASLGRDARTDLERLESVVNGRFFSSITGIAGCLRSGFGRHRSFQQFSGASSSIMRELFDCSNFIFTPTSLHSITVLPFNFNSSTLARTSSRFDRILHPWGQRIRAHPASRHYWSLPQSIEIWDHCFFQINFKTTNFKPSNVQLSNFQLQAN